MEGMLGNENKFEIVKRSLKMYDSYIVVFTVLDKWVLCSLPEQAVGFWQSHVILAIWRTLYRTDLCYPSWSPSPSASFHTPTILINPFDLGSNNIKRLLCKQHRYCQTISKPYITKDHHSIHLPTLQSQDC